MFFRSTRDATYNNEDGSVRMFLRGRPINLYAPTAEMATYDITKVATAPSSKLKLDWAYPLPTLCEDIKLTRGLIWRTFKEGGGVNWYIM